jgi:hypothetical protein
LFPSIENGLAKPNALGVASGTVGPSFPMGLPELGVVISGSCGDAGRPGRCPDTIIQVLVNEKADLSKKSITQAPIKKQSLLTHAPNERMMRLEAL